MFGYQIGPAYTAVADHNSSKAEGGDILQRQSFPALLLFGVRNEVAEPRVFRVQTSSPGADRADRLIVLRPYMSLQQTWHWSPLRRLFADNFRITESERASWVESLYHAQEQLGSERTSQFVDMRIKTLLTSVGATESLIPLPSRPAWQPLEVTSIAPAEWRLESDDKGAPKPVSRARFVLQGRGFQTGKTECRAQSVGSPISSSLATLAGEAIAICDFSIPPDGAGPLVVSLADSTKNAVAYATPVNIIAPSKPKVPAVK